MALTLFTLLNGIEVLGKTEGDFNADQVVTVEYPFIVDKKQQGQGQYLLDLFPYSLTNQEGKHAFMRSAVVSVSDTVPAMLENEYNTRTSSIILNGALDAFSSLK